MARHEPEALIHAEVDAAAIARVIADWTGVPVGSLLEDELATLLDLEARLARVVVGQDAALAALGKSLRAAKAGLKSEEAPLGVFLLVGPSGVGKTETARTLAESMFGGERALITINLSEYQEAHTVSQLKGSPPGYVGYGRGGVLTEAVRQRPYSVILLDEVEKAHRDVLDLFYQVFDRGVMRDGEGPGHRLPQHRDRDDVQSGQRRTDHGSGRDSRGNLCGSRHRHADGSHPSPAARSFPAGPARALPDHRLPAALGPAPSRRSCA